MSEKQIDHESLNEYRLANNPLERAFLEEWKEINKRAPMINHGWGTLEIILSSDFNDVQPISQRDANVAATVIQWLGTVCGQCFLRDVAERMKVAI